jgi:hypothetical protein
MPRLACALSLLALFPATALATTLEDILAEAEAQCLGMGGGTFAPGPAVQQVDLTGDGQPEVLIDWAVFACAEARSAFSGTGGSPLTVLVGEQRFEMRSKGWRLIDVPAGKVLLMQVHGTDCGGIGADPCFEAAIWNGERFMTLRPPAE